MKTKIHIESASTDPNANAVVAATLRKLAAMPYDDLLALSPSTTEPVAFGGKSTASLHTHRVIMPDNHIRVVVSLSSQKQYGPLETAVTARDGFVISRDGAKRKMTEDDWQQYD